MNVTSTTKEAVLAYGEEIADLYEKHAAPITDIDDERAQALIAHGFADMVEEYVGNDSLSKYLGDKYFNEVFDEKPEPPVEAPSWAASTSINVYADEASISYTSHDFSCSEWTGTLTHSTTIFFADTTDQNGTVHKAGEVLPDRKPAFYVPGIAEVSGSATDLRNIAELFLDAADALEDAEPRNVDEGPSIVDLVSFADLLRVSPPELLHTIEPLVLNRKPKTEVSEPDPPVSASAAMGAMRLAHMMREGGFNTIGEMYAAQGVTR